MLTLFLLTAGCLADPSPDDVHFSTAEQDFSMELFQDLAADSAYVKDVFFSPYSVFSDLLTMYVASAGATKQSLKQLLHFDASYKLDEGYIKEKFFHESSLNHSQNINQSLYILRSVDRVFYTPDYKVNENKEKQFGTKVAVFKSKNPAEEVNKWVSDETNGMIKKFINGEISTSKTTVFVNAAYFKGYWEVPLNGGTSPNTFTLANATSKSTLFMKPHGGKGLFSSLTDKDLKAQVISLPYKGDNISMIIILPTTKPQKQGSPAVAEVVKKLTHNKLQQLLADLEKQPICNTDLLIPKFESDERYDLLTIWNKFSKSSVFSGPLDLTNLFEPGQSVAVSSILHEAKVKVTENGTEAAAATGFISSCEPEVCSATFHADHPFVYLIYDNVQRFVHYMGILNDPKQS